MSGRRRQPPRFNLIRKCSNDRQQRMQCCDFKRPKSAPRRCFGMFDDRQIEGGGGAFQLIIADSIGAVHEQMDLR
jgi:hypothetical protein